MGKGASPSPFSFLECRTERARMNDIQGLTTRALADIAAAESPAAIEALRVSLVGKSGSITGQLKQLGKLPPEERKAAGAAINEVRDTVRSEEHTSELQSRENLVCRLLLEKKNVKIS